MNSVEQKFRLVPPKIREWFGSDAVDEIMFAIDAAYNLPDTETAIPSLLFAVEIGDLPPEKMAGELATQLNIPLETAEKIYQELKSKVLIPIAPELIAFGIGRQELAVADLREEYSATIPSPRPMSIPTAPSIAATPIISAAQSAPVAQSPLSPAPAPVSLYRDALASQAYIPSARVGNLSGVGDVSGTVSAAAPTYRPARIDLGVQSTKVDDTLKSIFVHRETHPLQQVNYGAFHETLVTMPSAPVPLAASTPLPGERFDAMPVVPPSAVITQSETVRVPESTPSSDTASSGGFFDSIMNKIAPWHAAKFGARRANAAAALADPIPSATIDYSEELPVAPPSLPNNDLPPPPQA